MEFTKGELEIMYQYIRYVHDAYPKSNTQKAIARQLLNKIEGEYNERV